MFNASYSLTVHETLFFLFGRQARQSVDIIIGLSHLGHDVDTQFRNETQTNLQLAFELARRNLAERSDKQCRLNQTLRSYPVFKFGEEILRYKPHQNTNGLNPKLLCPWRGPYTIRTQLSPVVNRVRLSLRDSGDASVHLAHL